MIVLFTDFGLEGPYVGQMKAILYREAPGIPVIDLFSDAPVHDPRASAYLLAAYAGEFPPGTVFLCVVDPGVGGARLPVALQADGLCYVGPGNGLFNIVARRSSALCCWNITWRPERLSATFHGRDLFAPLAALLARGEAPPGELLDPAVCLDDSWPDDYGSIVYIDRFGNAMTGVRAASLARDAILDVKGQRIGYARTYAEAHPGQAFWYENANGLVEIAVSGGRAADLLGLRPGDPVSLPELCGP
ncbi:MAG: S-adenosyl-l-methionine hydroxide adenosyltransferase family protein [Gammaproteobacteria bacterium]